MDQYWTLNKFGVIFPLSALSGVESIRLELEMLYMEGRASRIDDHYLIRHEVVCTFDDEERNLLGLPRVYPFIISIKSRGNMGSKSFGYSVTFQRSKNSHDVFVNPRVTGAFIEVNSIGGGLTYLFNEGQYQVIQLVTEFNKRQPAASFEEIANENYYNAAKVKEYSGSSRTIKLDERLKNKKIIRADKISIKIEKNGDGSYTVLPVLLHKTDNGYDAEFHTPFDDVFKNQKSSERNYLQSDGTTYVFDKTQAEALHEIKQYDHIDKDTAESIIKEPKTFLDSDAFCFNLDLFSDRVTGIGEFVRKNVPYIPREGSQWLPEEGTAVSSTPQEGQVSGPNEIEINMDNAAEWYENMVDAKDEGRSTIEMNGKSYRLTPDIVSKIKKTFRIFINGGIDVPPHKPPKKTTSQKGKDSALLIEDNLKEISYRASQRAHQIAGTVDIFSGIRDTISLYTHQKQGIRWMFDEWRKGHKGVLLADDMGLGKTLQAFGFISALKKARKTSMPSVLVVSPVTLLKNWENEYSKFVRDGLFDGVEELYGSNLRARKVKSISVDQVEKGSSEKQILIPAQGLKPIKMLDLGDLKENKIVITTYDTIRDYQLALGQVEWSVIVLDEAQNIKNPVTQIANAVKGMKYDFAVALTGTPVENSWVDLWSIMDFVEPGKLSDLDNFSKLYIKPVRRAKGNVKTIEEIGGKLRSELDPLFLRRMKDSIASELPNKIVTPRLLYMPEHQQKEYEAVLEKARHQKEDRKSMLEIIGQLRDISLCPDLSTKNIDSFLKMTAREFFFSSARLLGTYQELVNIRSKNEKVLIFVEARKLQVVLRQMIMRLFEIDVPMPINGAVSSAKRQEIVDRFNGAEGFQVLILSPKAAGVGLTITGANHVIHLSRCWNPAKEDQATDRVYRIGQKKDVTVYIPIARDKNLPKDSSFDEKLNDLLEFKRSLSKSALYPTGDSADDGIHLFEGLFGNQTERGTASESSRNNYWNIDDMSEVDPKSFEMIIQDLYKTLGYESTRTPYSGDGGADVVVRSKKPGGTNFLVQCKQTTKDKNMDDEGVKEIVTAKSSYQEFYKTQFQCVVVTNAPDFTAGAKAKAKSNNVQLIAHDELKLLLEKHPVNRY